MGLGYGDEGKGSVVDFLARCYKINKVIRFSGGSQCYHNVIDPITKKHHGFSQFSSGSFYGAETYLSRYVLVDPIALLNELDILGKDYTNLIHVDPDASVITPFHTLLNQVKAITSNSHNTCGVGIGETRKDELCGRGLKIRDLKSSDIVSKLIEIKNYKQKEIKNISNIEFHYDYILRTALEKYQEFISKIDISNSNLDGDLIFEGAQGVLLDEKYGAEGFNTWTDVTFNNALKLLKENNYQEKIIKLGTIRFYMTRHGNGPFVTEDKRVRFSESHNSYNGWQGNFRQGYLDLSAMEYSIKCSGGIDGLVINHLDYLPNKFEVCVRRMDTSDRTPFYGYPIYKTIKKEDFITFVEDFLQVKVVLKSFGPTWKDKEEVISF